MGYNPTVTNAKVPADLQKRIGFTDEEQKRLVDLDYAYMAKNDVGVPGLVEQVVQGLSAPTAMTAPALSSRRPRRRGATGRRPHGGGADRAGDDLRRRSACWRRWRSCSATA